MLITQRGRLTLCYMATVVVHKPTGKRFVIVGSGYGAWATSAPNAWMGNLAPDEHSEHCTLFAVCDEAGEIGWLKSEELQVLTVDGKAPGQLIQSGGPYR